MRRALTQLLPKDHRLIEQRRCKRWDNNEPPKYQNGRISFSPTAFLLIGFLQLAAQPIAAAQCFHLSLRSTETAQRSSRKSEWKADGACS